KGGDGRLEIADERGPDDLRLAGRVALREGLGRGLDLHSAARDQDLPPNTCETAASLISTPMSRSIRARYWGMRSPEIDALTDWLSPLASGDAMSSVGTTMSVTRNRSCSVSLLPAAAAAVPLGVLNTSSSTRAASAGVAALRLRPVAVSSFTPSAVA